MNKEYIMTFFYSEKVRFGGIKFDIFPKKIMFVGFIRSLSHKMLVETLPIDFILNKSIILCDNIKN